MREEREDSEKDRRGLRKEGAKGVREIKIEGEGEQRDRHLKMGREDVSRAKERENEG